MARLLPFRVPKGVPADIRRALRLGMPGRFLSTLKALQLADLLGVREHELTRAHARTAAAIERAVRPETRERHYAVLRVLQEEYGAVRHGQELLAEAEGMHPLPPLASPDVVPVVKPIRPKPSPRREEEEEGEEEPEEEDSVAPDEGALEWEVGVDYTEEVAGHRHEKGRASDVVFNARIFRDDGRTMTAEQARGALVRFAREGTMPRGIEVRSVTWSNWKGSESEGDEDDLDSFRNILAAVGRRGVRVGAVKS